MLELTFRVGVESGDMASWARAGESVARANSASEQVLIRFDVLMAKVPPPPPIYPKYS